MWMTSPLRETFPQPANKEGHQKVKRMRKNRNLTVCKKGGKVLKCLLMGKRLFHRGSHLPFSDSQIFRVDRSATLAQKTLRKTPLTVAALSLAPVLFLLSILPPFCPLAGLLLALPAALPVRRPTSTWWPRGFHSRLRRRCCQTTSHSWHCSLRMVFGNPSVWECLPHRVPLSL